MDWKLTLSIASGVFWTITYILIIRRSFQDQTYGMPLAALCTNITWEGIFAFVHPHDGVQRIIDIIWFGFDLVILYQLLRYGRREFPRMSQAVFISMIVVGLITGGLLVYLISYDQQDWRGAYAAFGQNLMMSILFISMAYQRNSLRGQSVWIGVNKLIGTLLASLAFYIYRIQTPLFIFLYLAILFFDGVYVAQLALMARAERAKQAAPAETVRAVGA